MRLLRVDSQNAHHFPSLKISRFLCLNNDSTIWLRDI